MAFRKLFFKRVQGIRDNYLLQEGDIALDEDDFLLYRGDGSTIGGIAIAGGTSASAVSTGNGTDVTVTGGESTASGSTGGNTIITGGTGVSTGGDNSVIGGTGGTTGGGTNVTGGTGGTNGGATSITGGTGTSGTGGSTSVTGGTGGTTGGNTNITGGAGGTTGGNVNINGGNGSTDGNINIGTENTTLITIGTSGNNIDFPATTTIDFTGATVTGLSLSGVSNDVVNDTTPQLGGNLDLNSKNITGTGNISITGTVTSDGVSLGDDEKVNLGASNDLQLYHDSTFNNSVINNVNGHLVIRNDPSNTTKDVYIQSDNDVLITSIAAGETFAKFSDDAGVELYFNNVKKFETTSTGATVTGIFNIGDGSVSDNYIGLGAANDLKIFHNGSHSIIRETGTGNLYVQSDNNVILGSDSGTETYVKGIYNGSVELYHNNVKKFDTGSHGVDIVDEAHIEGATPHLTLKRTDNANVPTVRFKGSGGVVGASINFDGTSGTANELAFQTYDGASLAERFRVTYTGAKVSGNLQLGSTTAVSSVLDEDNFASDSATALATQQSIKAYVDGRFTQTTTTVNSLATDGLSITDNNVSANRTNDDLILSASGTGNVIINSNAKFNDNDKLLFGDSDDLEVFHNGTHSFIKDSGTGSLKLLSNNFNLRNVADTEHGITYASGGAVDLYHNGVKKFETTSTGIGVVGNARFDAGVEEKFHTVTGASGVTALDCSNGHIFYKTGCTGDITANFTNLTLTAEYAVNLMVIINQGGTPYEVTAVQIGGSAQTLNWQGGSQPTGNANGIDAFSFTILNDGGSYVVLGQMVDFT